jgi:outer membrane protein
VTACNNNNECIQVDSWQVGIAIGVGVKTNPLIDGSNIPLVILPDIAWYGQKAYFDNGELGYQWLEAQKFEFDTFIRLDSERAFFSFLHPANIFLPQIDSATDFPIDNAQVPSPNLSIKDIANRRWAANGGIRLRYLVGKNQWQFAFLKDITQVHRGHQFTINYSYKWNWQDVGFRMNFGVNWKSAKLIDYYYGVSTRDTTNTVLHYKAASGWQPHISIAVQKPISKNWLWLADLGYQKLPSSMVNSPIIEDSSIQQVFLGVAYRF